jgi:DUF3027 family protein
MNVQQSDLSDPALVTEVDLARAAAQEEAGGERVGDYVDHHIEDEAAVTHLFEADKSGYGGWRWAVTITSAGPDTDITVSEVVLLPGPDALVAPDWVPWQERVMAGDLGVGDLLPTSPDDPRLVAAYVGSDDPAVEETAMELGLGRLRVMSRPARLEAADRWHQSEFGPRSDMARSAPAHCGTCGFYLPLAGSLRAAFGTCGNELSPADAHVVHVEYGCGAHSEADVEQVSPVLVADLIYDDAQLDVEPLTVAAEAPKPTGETEAPVPEPRPAAEEAAAAVEPEAVTAEPETAFEPGAVVESEAVVESADAPAEAIVPEPAATESVADIGSADAVTAPESVAVEEAATDAESGDVPAEAIAPPEPAIAVETTADETGPTEIPGDAPSASAAPALPAEDAPQGDATPDADVASQAGVVSRSDAAPQADAAPRAEAAPPASPVEAAQSAPAAETFPDVSSPSAPPVSSAEVGSPASGEAPAVDASAVRRRRPVSSWSEEPVGPSVPSPLRPTIEQPRGSGPRRMPRLSAIFPDGLIRRRNFGPAEDE